MIIFLAPAIIITSSLIGMMFYWSIPNKASSLIHDDNEIISEPRYADEYCIWTIDMGLAEELKNKPKS